MATLNTSIGKTFVLSVIFNDVKLKSSSKCLQQTRPKYNFIDQSNKMLLKLLSVNISVDLDIIERIQTRISEKYLRSFQSRQILQNLKVTEVRFRESEFGVHKFGVYHFKMNQNHNKYWRFLTETGQMYKKNVITSNSVQTTITTTLTNMKSDKSGIFAQYLATMQCDLAVNSPSRLAPGSTVHTFQLNSNTRDGKMDSKLRANSFNRTRATLVDSDSDIELEPPTSQNLETIALVPQVRVMEAEQPTDIDTGKILMKMPKVDRRKFDSFETRFCSFKPVKSV